ADGCRWARPLPLAEGVDALVGEVHEQHQRALGPVRRGGEGGPGRAAVLVHPGAGAEGGRQHGDLPRSVLGAVHGAVRADDRVPSLLGGDASVHQTSSPTSWGPPSRVPPVASSSALIGEGQDPYGSVVTMPTGQARGCASVSPGRVGGAEVAAADGAAAAGAAARTEGSSDCTQLPWRTA